MERSLDPSRFEKSRAAAPGTTAIAGAATGAGGPDWSDGEFCQIVPGGAVTWRERPEPFCCHATVIGPCGVGTTPLAEVRPLGCGSTVNVAKPGEVGCTPSTYVVRAGAAPLDQPWSYEASLSAWSPDSLAIDSHIVPGARVAMYPPSRLISSSAEASSRTA